MPFKCTTVSSLIHCYWTTRTSSSISISVRSIHSFTRMHECNEPTDRPRYVTPSGVFRGGGTVRCPPFGPTMKSFYRRLYMKRWGFLPFSSKNCKIQQCLMDFCVSKFQKNGRICGFHWTFRSKKCFSFRGASPPWPPDQGLCYALPLPNPKYATDYYFAFSIIFMISCNQKGSVMLRMHQIRFSPGLCPGPRWGSSWHSPSP